jgi:hypothetical protein
MLTRLAKYIFQIEEINRVATVVDAGASTTDDFRGDIGDYGNQPEVGNSRDYRLTACIDSEYE